MNQGSYIAAVNWLTKQEWRVIRVVSLLLVTGLAVKFYRPAMRQATSPGQSPPQSFSRPNLDMQEVNFDETVDRLLAQDARFAREAYHFTREALDYTQKLISRENKGSVRHVTGQELLEGIRQYALQQYGPMTMTVLEEWGVKNCRAFGEIVFNMVESGLLAKTEKDTRDDFQKGYDFTDAFRKPFWPQAKLNEEKKTVAG